jgi:hypothetical protein
VQEYANALLAVLAEPPDAQALSRYAAGMAWPICAASYWSMLASEGTH